MTNTGMEILNQVMNRWATEFRAAQAKQVINEHTIKSLGIFELESTERAALVELNSMANVESFELA